jgi:hypothetical protein
MLTLLPIRALSSPLEYKLFDGKNLMSLIAISAEHGRVPKSQWEFNNVYKWMDGFMSGWANELINKWVGEWMDEWVEW